MGQGTPGLVQPQEGKHGLEPALRAQLCPAAFLPVTGNAAAPPDTLCFLLLTSTELVPASGRGSGSVLCCVTEMLLHQVPDLGLSLPRASERGNGPTGGFVAYTENNYLIKNHWKPHAFAEMALLQRNLSRQISE